jgi:hypothetical protein
MERSYQRHSDWHDYKFSVEHALCLGDLQAAAHSIAIFCSALGSIHISSCGKKILLENLFQEKSCKQVALQL